MRRFQVGTLTTVLDFGRLIAVLDGKVKDGQLVALCPFCSRVNRKPVYHFHGVGEGARCCHCTDRNVELEIMETGQVVNNAGEYYVRKVELAAGQ